MAGAKDAGKALGGAIIDMRNRLAEVESREPITVPVPSVEVNADLAPIVEALANPAVAQALAGIAEAIKEQDDAALNDMASAIREMSAANDKVLTTTQAQFTTILQTLNGVADRLEKQGESIDALTRSILAPKRIVERDGKPIGVETIVN